MIVGHQFNCWILYRTLSEVVKYKGIYYSEVMTAKETTEQMLLQLNDLKVGDFPGSPVATTLPSNVGSIPDQESKIPHASQPKKIKRMQYSNKFNKDFKNGPHNKK